MGTVKINEKYFIEVESKVLTLRKLICTTKSDKPKYDIIGYYSNWEMVFDRLYKIFVAESISGKIELKQLKEIIENARKEIKEIAKGYDNLKAG
jgi:GH18 family chitinase